MDVTGLLWGIIALIGIYGGVLMTFFNYKTAKNAETDLIELLRGILQRLADQNEGMASVLEIPQVLSGLNLGPILQPANPFQQLADFVRGLRTTIGNAREEAPELIKNEPDVG